MNVFFMVWNPSGGSPVFRHSLRSQAVQEAERLARLHPEQVFFVLGAVSVSKKKDVFTEELYDASDDLPF